MDFEATLADINVKWAARRIVFTKSEISRISDKDTVQGKEFGFLTPSYHKRSRLIADGEIFYAYAFQDWNNHLEGEQFHYPTWVLFSPSREFRSNPYIYKEISEKLLTIKGERDLTRPLSRLRDDLLDHLSEAVYVEIPEPYSLGHLVYLSVVFIRPANVPHFRLGVNLAIAAKSISSEIIYLPEEYWTNEYASFYQSGQ